MVDILGWYSVVVAAGSLLSKRVLFKHTNLSRTGVTLMFRIHRKYLAHQIWKARVICIGDQVSEKTFGILKQVVHRYLAALDYTALVLLFKILTRQSEAGLCFKARSGPSSSCSRSPLDEDIEGERYLLSRVWRWPQLKDTHDFKHIESACESQSMEDCLCVNPFHFSRIIKRDTIPYRNFQASKEMDFEDSGLSCTSRETQSDTEETIPVGPSCTRTYRPSPAWVKLAYWEGNTRVGHMFHGYDKTINIYESIAKSKENRTGFCLRELERTREMNEPTKVVFKNIGNGVQVNLEDGNIWIYNNSLSSVFLNGELLQTLYNTRTPKVEKLPSGYGLKIFDCRTGVNKRRNEPYSLRVSFVKGFGSGYKRQYITNCPCWIEMFFFSHES